MKILVVDDNQTVHEALRRSLTSNGYTVELAEDDTEALGKIARDRPDPAILDVVMPKLDGLDVCHQLRSEGDNLLVMMLTVRDLASERVAGLDAGADDYLPKPFALGELLARVCPLLRRSTLEVPVMENAVVLQFEDLSLDPGIREVFHGEHRIGLTRTELALLGLLMGNSQCVLSRTVILEDVWGYNFPTPGNALEIYAGYLRRKTEAEGGPRLIRAVRGAGYAMRKTAP